MAVYDPCAVCKQVLGNYSRGCCKKCFKQGTEEAPCLHCGKGPVKARGLCRACYYTPSIREQYAAQQPGTKLCPAEYECTLPVLTHYPLIEEQPACPCGLPDGECPACERQQRAGIVWAERPHEVNPSVPRILRRVYGSRPSFREMVNNV